MKPFLIREKVIGYKVEGFLCIYNAIKRNLNDNISDVIHNSKKYEIAIDTEGVCALHPNIL